MDISRIDYWAYTGDSVMHRASVASKLVATGLVVASVVLTRELCILSGLLAVVFITARAARLPLVKILLIAVFPSLFALLFAAGYASSGWRLPAAVMLKALTAASSMVLLVSTTPYVEVAGNIGRFMPRVVADGLLMTYRSFFILLGLLDNFIEALKLRGGFRPRRVIANAGHMGAGLGMLFIRAYEKSQRLYEVMYVRGYSGRLAARPGRSGLGVADLPYTFMAALFLVYAAVPGTGGETYMKAIAPVLIVYFAVMEAFTHWKR